MHSAPHPTVDQKPPGAPSGPGKVRFVTLYHQVILEGTLGLTSFSSSPISSQSTLSGLDRKRLLEIRDDETRHIGCGVWFLRETVCTSPEMADVIRATLRDSLALGGRVAQAARGKRLRRPTGITEETPAASL